MYQIITKTSSFLQRSVTFSVDGKIETISAPAATATFDDLLLRIEEKYGDKEKTVTVKPDDGEKPKEAPSAPKTTAPAKGRKKTSQK